MTQFVLMYQLQYREMVEQNAQVFCTSLIAAVQRMFSDPNIFENWKRDYDSKANGELWGAEVWKDQQDKQKKENPG